MQKMKTEARKVPAISFGLTPEKTNTLTFSRSSQFARSKTEKRKDEGTVAEKAFKLHQEWFKVLRKLFFLYEHVTLQH